MKRLEDLTDVEFTLLQEAFWEHFGDHPDAVLKRYGEKSMEAFKQRYGDEQVKVYEAARSLARKLGSTERELDAILP